MVGGGLCDAERSEAYELTGVEIVCSRTAAQAANALLALGPKAALITLGERGAFYSDGEQSFLVPSFPVVVVDTTAAGDARSAAASPPRSRHAGRRRPLPGDGGRRPLRHPAGRSPPCRPRPRSTDS
ncbi:PfkB family carbohydrate kinase [Thauera sp. SDU_THAU2]|uniref:PfkB family carbohydrate kinase n=1 Tax=Thauera sp. SDU_THAU2 TaxID=3136633 RepID=UPI004054FEF1